MKKLSVLSLGVILIMTGFFLFNKGLNAQKIEGWFLTGSHADSYMTGLDKSVYKTGGSCAYVESKGKKIEGFGTLMQSCSAEDYLGQRVKMTAYIKTKDVANWAGMWLRVDSKTSNKLLSFDNMYDRPVKGTCDWTKCEIVLDVPEESNSLNFGVLLNGTGKVWFDDISFQIVDKSEAKTDKNSLRRRPSNLDFSE